VVPVEAVFDPARHERLCATLRQVPPEMNGFPSTRWTLDRLLLALDWLEPRTASGLWRLLRRERIRLRSGGRRLFSPDPDYATKEAAVLAALRQVAADPDQQVALFCDQMAYHHWPEPGSTWSSLDDEPPCAERAAPGERHKKVMGALNARTGQVTHYHRMRMCATQVADFLTAVREDYPRPLRLIAILDNAPVHHTEVVTTRATALGIELVFLPTYSPWLNPIEKLWAWLRTDVLRLHRQAGHWEDVPPMVQAFLNHFRTGSDQLLRRVGLSGDGMLAQAIHGISP
jgi:hypothetical protein